MRLTAIIAVAASAVTMFATAAQAQPVGISTSPQGTLTYAVGAAVAKVLNEAGGIQARVQPSSGTGSGMPLVNSGEIDLGLANTLELYDAYHGAGTFNGRPANKNLRAIAVIFPIKVGLFVRNDSPIKSIKDMKGHSVAYGFTSQEIIKKTVDAMLATDGLSIQDLKPVMVPNLVRGVDELVSGRADITTFALGSGKVSEADAAVGIRFVSLPDTPAALKGLKSEFRTAYIGHAQPSPRYAGVKGPINIMQYDYTLFASSKVKPEVIKKITEILANNKDKLGAAHPLFKSMDVSRMYNDIEVPYHDAAKAYYAEKGIKETK
jgi:TRAP transporter TAXI family solute receptor